MNLTRGAVLGAVAMWAACAQPLPIERREWVLGQLVARTPARGEAVRLVRPRFGLPAIEKTGERVKLQIELLGPDAKQLPHAALVDGTLSDDDAAACVRAGAAELRDGCWPLALTPGGSRPLDGTGILLLNAHAELEADGRAPAAGGYDLVLVDDLQRFVRARRSVWLRAEDPATLTEVRVAQLSDLHIGKRHGDQIAERLVRVIDEINRLHPDVVLVTGDLVESGSRAKLMPVAAAALLRVDAPLLIVPGNHDHGFAPGVFSGRELGAGWAAFAESFHPSLYFETMLGGWRFVGFDSGASVFSPFVWTRGVGESALRTLQGSLDSAQHSGDRGAILFSHAPSRARVTGRGPSKTVGMFGRMLWGAEEFERLIRAAATPQFRVLHLSGHTHWSDVFEEDAQGAFVRWDRGRLLGGQREVLGRAALVNAQSATHTTFNNSAHGRGYGFVWLVLREGAPLVEVRRFTDPPPI